MTYPIFDGDGHGPLSIDPKMYRSRQNDKVGREKDSVCDNFVALGVMYEFYRR